MNEAYKSVQFESVRKMYLDREKLLSITAPKVDVEEIKEKLKIEVEAQGRQLQSLVNSLIAENMDQKQRLQGLETRILGLEKLFRELSDSVKALDQ